MIEGHVVFRGFYSIGKLESMIEYYLGHVIMIVLLQSQIGIHETNIFI